MSILCSMSGRWLIVGRFTGVRSAQDISNGDGCRVGVGPKDAQCGRAQTPFANSVKNSEGMGIELGGPEMKGAGRLRPAPMPTLMISLVSNELEVACMHGRRMH